MLKDFLQGKWLGHPLHPALVHVPTALFPAATFFDLLSFFGVGANVLVRTSFYAIGLALLTVLAAVPTGIADWSDIKRGKPAWKIGLYHMLLNIVAASAFVISFVLRWDDLTADRISAVQLTWSVIGTLILFVSGYLGGLMVFDHGINVARQSKEKWRTIAEAGKANVPEQKSDGGGD